MISHIIKILQTEDTVSINELGMFAKHYVPAHIEENMIVPPHFEVTLDTSNDNHTEMFFAEFVSRERKCRIVEAADAVAQWVNDLKNALASNKSVTYEQFGTFSKNEKDKILFSCCHIDDLNIEFEGLKPVPLTPEPAAAAEPEHAAVAEPEPVAAAEPEPAAAAEPEPAAAAEPEPAAAAEPEPAAAAEPEPAAAAEPEPAAAAEPEPAAAAEPEPAAVVEPEPAAVAEPEPAAAAEPEPVAAAEPEPAAVAEPEPAAVAEPEPAAAAEPEPVAAAEPEPVAVAEPEAAAVAEPEPAVGKQKKQRNSLWLFVLIIVIAVVALIYLFREPIWNGIRQLFDKITTTERAAESPEALPVEMPVPEEGDISTDEPETQETIEEEAIAEEEAIVEEGTTTPYTPEIIRTTADGKYQYIRFEYGHFYVIAGSFRAEKDLEALVRQNHLDEYRPTFVVQEGVPNIRVCIGIYDTEEEALVFAKNLNERYWVLK